MTETLGSATLDLRTDDSRFDRGINEARNAARGLDRSFQGASSRILAGLRSVAGPLITVAGIAGFGLLVKNSVRAADAVGKTADKIGVGVEALQELRFAAEQSGVAQRALDLGLQRFSRRVGEAVQGGGELRDTLKQYNIQLRDSEGRTRSVVDILGDYAEAVKNAGSGQEQLRLAFKGFDSEGAALVNLLRQGREGVEKLREQARSLGIVLDESMVRSAEDANDQLNIMRRVLSTNLRRALLTLAPTIIKIGNAFAAAAPKVAEFVEAMLPLEQRSLTGLKAALGQLEERRRQILAPSTFDRIMGRTQKTLDPATRALLERTDQQIAKVKELIAAEKEQADVNSDLVNSVDALTGGAGGGGGGGISEMNAQFASLAAELKAGTIDVETYNREVMALTPQAQASRQSLGDLEAAFEKQRQAASAATENVREFRREMFQTMEGQEFGQGGAVNLQARLDARRRQLNEQSAQSAEQARRQQEALADTEAELARQRARAAAAEAERIDQLQRRLRLNMEGVRGQMEAERQLERSREERERMEARRLAELADGAREFGSAMQTALERMVFDGAELRKVLKFLLADLARLALRAQTLGFFKRLFTAGGGTLFDFTSGAGGTGAQNPGFGGDVPGFGLNRASFATPGAGSGNVTIVQDFRGAEPGVEHRVAAAVEQMRDVATRAVRADHDRRRR